MKRATKPKQSRSGRPSTYSKALAATICERLSDGESLRAICRNPDMPSRDSVFRWLRVHPEFSDQYARARELQADALADEILAIADDGSRDYVIDEDGIKRVDHEHIQRSRLRVDARKWYAAKLAPKKYGDKIEHSADDALSLLLNNLAPTVGPPSERDPT